MSSCRKTLCRSTWDGGAVITPEDADLEKIESVRYDSYDAKYETLKYNWTE
ncbi:hypothetical protein BpJC7_25990 [Weizmannia acidilactici]|uniref:Uncharacterized protein n=1 Tax=Weizmannia acidilactici TaxID=2607726 RepID=A0A5J4J8Y2_9BACI|nr:hypothetical protein BpJC4_19050 [Weizmannia acidilactici]GER71296.1 hypothetical protein BpJC7_25990 [Weizmannia acidilactici]GER72568.1 hypothetical protein BpPP18_06350 [Weizmannia acidilactici]